MGIGDNDIDDSPNGPPEPVPVPPLEEINIYTNIFLSVLVIASVLSCVVYIARRSMIKYYLTRGINTEISWSNERTYCGRPVSCKIKYVQQSGDPIKPEDLEDIVAHIIVYVEKVDERVKISVVIEDNDISSNGLTATFTVRKAGDYNIFVNYSCFFWEYAFNGSPFVKEFSSAEINPSKTKLDVRNPNFICLQTGIVHQIKIDARDYYGNVCDSKDVDLTQFQFSMKDTQTSENYTGGTIEGNFVLTEVGKTPCLHLKALQDSVYQASVLYSGHPIQHGSEFFLISLSSNEEEAVEKNLMSFNSILKYFFQWTNIQFVGLLFAIDRERRDVENQPCKVRITITPRYISVEEDFGILYWQKASYNITAKTELTFLDCVTVKGEIMYSVQLGDGIQLPLTILLQPGDARILLVTFAHFQGEKLRTFGSFEEKKKCFQKNLCGTSLYWRHSTRHIKLYRSDLLKSMMEQVELFSYHDWCAFFSVSFEEEIHRSFKPAPAVRQLSNDYEWLNLVCDEIFTHNPVGMFSYLGSTKLLHPNLAKYRNPKWQEKHYEFAGKLLGKCVYESAAATNSSLHVRFSRSLLAQLVGLPVSYQHLVQDYPEECDKVKDILKSEDVDKMNLTFTIDDDIQINHQGILQWIGISPADKNKINVIPNGSNVKVTNANKIFYLSAVAHYELAYKVAKEIAALRRGFHTLVSQELLADISEYDLDLLLCGGTTVNVKDLKDNHSLSASHVTTERRDIILSWFWTSVTNMVEDEKLRLLQLVTGSCVLPAGGFKKLYPPFTISIKGSFGQRPMAIPSLHEISLADHSSYEKFEKNLIEVVRGDWRVM